MPNAIVTTGGDDRCIDVADAKMLSVNLCIYSGSASYLSFQSRCHSRLAFLLAVSAVRRNVLPLRRDMIGLSFLSKHVAEIVFWFLRS